jgi:hypothetical protein
MHRGGRGIGGYGGEEIRKYTREQRRKDMNLIRTVLEDSTNQTPSSSVDRSDKRAAVRRERATDGRKKAVEGDKQEMEDRDDEGRKRAP